MIYLLFAFDSYYPGGGTADFVGAYDAAGNAAALEHGKRLKDMHDRHFDHWEVARLDGSDLVSLGEPE